MSMVDDLRSMLIAHGIDDTSYDDSVLESFILEAKLLVDEPFMFDTVHEDYDPTFNGDTFMTSTYPLLSDGLELTINDEIVTPSHITSEGIIYLDKYYQGKLHCNYSVGLTSDDIQTYLLPISLNIIMEKEGLNISTISEGDVSIGYDNNNSISSQTSQLIQALKNKYNGRVVFI